MKGCVAPGEELGQSRGTGGGTSKNVAAIAGTKMKDCKEPVAELRRQLQKAELEKSLAEETASMHMLLTKGDNQDVRLGPTVSAAVLFEGTSVSALLDTGAPVSIISLGFLLEVLKKQDQTPAD